MFFLNPSYLKIILNNPQNLHICLSIWFVKIEAGLVRIQGGSELAALENSDTKFRNVVRHRRGSQPVYPGLDKTLYLSLIFRHSRSFV